MSYILEALRRAEADRDRKRGQVPGLHTQPQPGPAGVPAEGQRHGWLWVGGGLLLMGIGAVAWWVSSPNPPAARVLSAAPPAPTAPAAQVTATMPTPAVTPAAAPVASPPAPPPAASIQLEPPPAAVAAALAAAPAPVPPPPQPPPRSVAAPAPTPQPALAPAPAAEPRIPRLAELPESTRRELPKMTIAGSVYSDNPASRFVIINGEVQREGAQLGAELLLEQIRSHELVLRFKGQRFRQPV